MYCLPHSKCKNHRRLPLLPLKVPKLSLSPLSPLSPTCESITWSEVSTYFSTTFLLQATSTMARSSACLEEEQKKKYTDPIAVTLAAKPSTVSTTQKQQSTTKPILRSMPTLTTKPASIWNPDKKDCSQLLFFLLHHNHQQSTTINYQQCYHKSNIWHQFKYLFQ